MLLVGPDDGETDDIGFCGRKQIRAQIDHALPINSASSPLWRKPAAVVNEYDFRHNRS
jgi:hypothetical protein